MGGDITIAPRRGGGTTFALTVTLDRAKAANGGAEADRSSASMPALRILGVEDNPFGRVVLNTILTELGHQAEFIGKGEEAVERIARGDFDAVLMDMVLPGIDGIEAIERIRKLDSALGRIPVIGVSGRGEDEAAARTAGADAFLVKPVSPRALATALLEATRAGQARLDDRGVQFAAINEDRGDEIQKHQRDDDRRQSGIHRDIAVGEAGEILAEHHARNQRRHIVKMMPGRICRKLRRPAGSQA